MTDHRTTSATAREFTDGWFAVQAVHVVDALLDRDGEGVKTLLDRFAGLLATEDDLPPNVQGRVQGLSDVLRWALERLVTLQAHERYGIGAGTREHAFLALLASEGPSLNAAVRDKLELSASDASKIGRTLREAGFVVRRQLGREVLWEITPRGKAALQQLDLAQRGRSSPSRGSKVIEFNTASSEVSVAPSMALSPTQRAFVAKLAEDLLDSSFGAGHHHEGEFSFDLALDNHKSPEMLLLLRRSGLRRRSMLVSYPDREHLQIEMRAAVSVEEGGATRS